MMDPEATFEREVQWISVLKTELDNVNKEGMKFFNEKVKPLVADAKLLELIGLNAEFDNLVTRLNNC